MIEYNYTQIQRFDKTGIQLDDGTIINFEECRANWAKSRGVNLEDTFCVADRGFFEKTPYFTFYTNTRVKIIFKRSFFPWNTHYKKRFLRKH